MKEKVIGYHGTDKSEYDNLNTPRFYNIETNKKLPCDLGIGLYLYLNRGHNEHEAVTNVRKYLERWKPRYKNKIIAEIHVENCNDKILDFDDYENRMLYEEFRDDNEENIKKVIDTLIKDNSFNRGNFDGLIIELLIEEFKIDVDAITKETYTQFDMDKKQKRSNFSNGKEMCLRNYSNISKKCIYN